MILRDQIPWDNRVCVDWCVLCADLCSDMLPCISTVCKHPLGTDREVSGKSVVSPLCFSDNSTALGDTNGHFLRQQSF